DVAISPACLVVRYTTRSTTSVTLMSTPYAPVYACRSWKSLVPVSLARPLFDGIPVIAAVVGLSATCHNLTASYDHEQSMPSRSMSTPSTPVPGHEGALACAAFRCATHRHSNSDDAGKAPGDDAA